MAKSSEYASLSKKHQGQSWVVKRSVCPTGQIVVAPALASAWESRNNLQLKAAYLGRALMVGWEAVASKAGDKSPKLPPPLKETGIERQVGSD